MIDIHTHILPRLDDGAKDTATAVAMLQAELAQGVDKVVLTSHFYGKRHSPQQFLEKRAAAFAHLQEKIPQGIEIYLGAEVHFTGVNIADYEELCKLSIGDTNFILIEFPFTTVWTRSLPEKLSEFICETGYTPIIAHVERYREVQKNPALVNELVEMGCLIQVNADSFLQKRDKGLAFALLKHGLVHCIGSDTHDMGERAPRLAEAREALEKAGYAYLWERAQKITSEILEGGQVCVERCKPVKKFFGKYF